MGFLTYRFRLTVGMVHRVQYVSNDDYSRKSSTKHRFVNHALTVWRTIISMLSTWNTTKTIQLATQVCTRKRMPQVAQNRPAVAVGVWNVQRWLHHTISVWRKFPDRTLLVWIRTKRSPLRRKYNTLIYVHSFRIGANKMQKGSLVRHCPRHNLPFILK